GHQFVRAGVALDRAGLHRHLGRVVPLEERGVHDELADGTGQAEADDRVVVAGFSAPPGFPPVVHLSLVAEGVGLEDRFLRLDQVLPFREQLVVGVDDAAAERAGREVRQDGRGRGGAAHQVLLGDGWGAVPLQPARSSRCPAGGGISPGRYASCPRNQVARTTPASGRPWYGVTGLRCCSWAASTTNASSGAKTQKSAANPGAIAPLPATPAISAGRAAIHRTTSASWWPRCRAWVHTADRPSCRLETPPQACPKSPVSKRFSSGVHGEWSLTTQSTVPSASPRQSSSRLPASRMGGQHLNWVAPSGISSAQKVR